MVKQFFRNSIISKDTYNTAISFIPRVYRDRLYTYTRLQSYNWVILLKKNNKTY